MSSTSTTHFTKKDDPILAEYAMRSFINRFGAETARDSLCRILGLSKTTLAPIATGKQPRGTALEHLRFRKGSYLHRILAYVAQHPFSGATNDEIVDQVADELRLTKHSQHESLRVRISELKRGGYLKADGERYEQTIFVPTDKAYKALAKIEETGWSE